MRIVYKIMPEAVWREAEARGRYEGAAIDLEDGYIHLSTASQLAETAARHFAGQRGLCLVAIDAAALGSGLRFEPSRGGAYFPHLYGDLAPSAVAAIHPFPLQDDGTHRLPDEVQAAGRLFEPETAGWVAHPSETFFALVGPLWRRPPEEENAMPIGTGRFGLLAEPRHLNRNGIMHGGMIMTFADQALGLLGQSQHPDRTHATIQLDTHFVSAVQAGEFVEARCRIVRRAQAVMFLAGDLAVDGRIVATAQGVWRIRNPRA